jgi:hypothetical protein
VEEGGNFVGAQYRGLKSGMYTAMRCLAMGGPYARYHAWSRDMEFLYSAEGIKEEYSSQWEVTKMRFNEIQDTQTAATSTAQLLSTGFRRICGFVQG